MVMADIRKLMGGGGWIWTNTCMLAVDVEVDAQAAAKWLPFGLCLSRPAKATLFVAEYPWTSFGIAYREAAVLLHVKWMGMRALHCPWMLVDDDVALILGRELLGYPKKMGNMTLSVKEDRVEASVERAGIRLIEMKGDLGEKDRNPPPLMAHRTVNAWGVIGLSLPKLLMFTPREEVLEARKVSISLQVRGSERDPLDALKVGRVFEARLYRTHMGSRKLIPLPVGILSPLYLLRNWALRFR